jgi:hypothetical protein
MHFTMADPIPAETLQDAHDDLLTITSAIQALSSFAPDELLFQRDLLMKIVNRLYNVEKLLPQLEAIDKNNHAILLSHYDAAIQKKENLLLHVERALQEKHYVLCPNRIDRILMKVLWGTEKGSAMWDQSKKTWDKERAAFTAAQESFNRYRSGGI